jgi:PTH1 family peptidyl-tRNA hydrolase
MNESGVAVQEALSYFSCTPESLVLLHDDSDMLMGEYKIQYDSGSAGHRGVSSVIKHIGTQKFYRIRIGIRPKQFFLFQRKKAGDFVLSHISKRNKEILTQTFQKIITEILPESLKE